MSTAREILIGPMAEAKRLLPTVPFSANACILLLATGLQESKLAYRRQLGNGPARGLWQFERGGGVKGVLTHPASAGLAISLADARGVAPTAAAAWAALEMDDVLAAGFARLLYWTDPSRVPDRSDVDGAWDMYLRNWRPGKPHPATWAAHHASAVATVINANDA